METIPFEFVIKEELCKEKCQDLLKILNKELTERYHVCG
jgi:hypothetical protein